MTTITLIALDTFAIRKDGSQIATATAHALSAIDYDIAQTVAKAQEQPGIPIVVPSVTKVKSPRYARPATMLLQ